MSEDGLAPKRFKSEYVHTRGAFMEAYEVLREELLTDELVKNHPVIAKDWYKEVLDYNVPGGKLNRGMAVYDAFAAIKGSESLSPTDIKKANALGWCIEWLQAFFLVADDIMDGSITRRGQPCWYKQNKVGLIACNDFILLECCIYRIIRNHFSSHENYGRIVDMFHEVTYQTAHGQLLDLITSPQGTVDLDRYTLDTYLRIVTYKTAFYSFYLPIACGMLLAGIKDDGAYAAAKDILIEMGQFFQIQDDYLDCYGDPKVIGKHGTDIEDNKCSWLICTAIQHASDAEKELIKHNYGRKDSTSVATIKKLYKVLDVHNKYKAYEAASYEKLSQQIEAQTALPKEVFTSMLNKIYKREK